LSVTLSVSSPLDPSAPLVSGRVAVLIVVSFFLLTNHRLCT
jgi:hypothetical protein